MMAVVPHTSEEWSPGQLRVSNYNHRRAERTPSSSTSMQQQLAQQVLEIMP